MLDKTEKVLCYDNSAEWCKHFLPFVCPDDEVCLAHQSVDKSISFSLVVSPELSSVRDYVITHSVCSMYVCMCMCMYVVFCKIDHCIHIHWCIVMGLGHNDPWVESHMWPQQTWGQRSSRGQWPLVQVFGKKGQCIHILWCIFKSNITMIARVCDRESRRDTWFENRLGLHSHVKFP